MGGVLKAVPVLDFDAFHGGSAEARRRVAGAVDRACKEVGFFLLTGHGVPPALIEGVHEASRQFFGLPEPIKRACEPAPGDFLGYRGVGTERSSTADTTSPPNLRERFALGPQGKYRRKTSEGHGGSKEDRWPGELEGLRDAVASYYESMSALSSLLLRAFALGLDLKEDFFEDKIDRSISYLVLLGYPEQREEPLPRQMRNAPHRDRSCFTILTTDGPGLQVLTGDDAWLDVHSPKEVLVVNVGSMLARWTGERWVSAMHQVANPPAEMKGVRRHSIAFFFNPNDDVVLAPLTAGGISSEQEKPPPVTVSEYLRTMLDLHSKY
jgi:isopenicillin N synthase-like dioxygenase